MKTLIVGLGNPILTDDGVGVKVAYRLQECLAGRVPNGLSIVEACVGGLRLMELMIGYDRVILIDAMTHGDVAPGTVQRLTLDDLRAISPTQHSASAHDTTLITALAAGRQMGLSLPDEVVIYGVAVENVIDFGDQPTPAVDKVIPEVTQAVLAEIAVMETEGLSIKG
ncbi:MAG: hydrogenase maturation protease [Chloroflexota bacterium]|nr:hydrogenase maturation protease [Chloroflexota bacterium]